MAECCTGGTKLLYSCSGAADVGKLADLVSRKLRDDGYARMTCLAGVGADLSGFVESAKGADANITIDGCPTACARKSLERIGVAPIAFILSDFGCVKGSTAVTDALVADTAGRIKSGASGKAQAGTIRGGCECGGTC